jgi:hypothetical protein
MRKFAQSGHPGSDGHQDDAAAPVKENKELLAGICETVPRSFGFR